MRETMERTALKNPSHPAQLLCRLIRVFTYAKKEKETTDRVPWQTRFSWNSSTAAPPWRPTPFWKSYPCAWATVAGWKGRLFAPKGFKSKQQLQPLVQLCFLSPQLTDRQSQPSALLFACRTGWLLTRCLGHVYISPCCAGQTILDLCAVTRDGPLNLVWADAASIGCLVPSLHQLIICSFKPPQGEEIQSRLLKVSNLGIVVVLLWANTEPCKASIYRDILPGKGTWLTR